MLLPIRMQSSFTAWTNLITRKNSFSIVCSSTWRANHSYYLFSSLLFHSINSFCPMSSAFLFSKINNSNLPKFEQEWFVNPPRHPQSVLCVLLYVGNNYVQEAMWGHNMRVFYYLLKSVNIFLDEMDIDDHVVSVLYLNKLNKK